MTMWHLPRNMIRSPLCSRLVLAERAAVVGGLGVSSYDHTKQFVQRALGETESLSARFAAAMVGGAMTALVGTPFDVAKTRMMNEHLGAGAGVGTGAGAGALTLPAGNAQGRVYPSVLRCFASIVRSEGPLALWKGLAPVYVRNAPFTMANYLLMESLTLAFLGRSM